MCIVTFDWEKNDAVEKFKFFDKQKSLTWAVIEVTERCNFNCMWCYASSGMKIFREMTKEDVEKVIKILAKSGVRQVTFSGGEPLLYPHIKDVIKTAKSYGLVVHMNTNGYFLTKPLAKELYELGLSQVQINIDSINPAKHDRIRGKKGSFKRVIRAFKNAHEVGIICTSQTVLTKENEGEVLDIFKFARSLGIQRCRIWDIMPVGHAIGKMDLRPKNYLKTLKVLTEFACETGACNIESGEPLFPLEYKTSLGVTGVGCVAVSGVLINISCGGDVYFCVTERKPMFNILRDLGTEKLSDFYKLELGKHAQKFKVPKKCNKCNFIQICRGGCPIRRSFNSKNIDYWCR